MRQYRAVAVLASAVLLLALPANCVRISPDLAPITVPYDSGLTAVQNLPFDYNNGVFSTVKTAPGCSPEQVRFVHPLR